MAKVKIDNKKQWSWERNANVSILNFGRMPKLSLHSKSSG